MSKKVKLQGIIGELKIWALDNQAPSELHSIIQKIHEEIETMDGDEEGEVPGGNHPKQPPNVP